MYSHLEGANIFKYLTTALAQRSRVVLIFFFIHYTEPVYRFFFVFGYILTH